MEEYLGEVRRSRSEVKKCSLGCSIDFWPWEP